MGTHLVDKLLITVELSLIAHINIKKLLKNTP